MSVDNAYLDTYNKIISDIDCEQNPKRSEIFIEALAKRNYIRKLKEEFDDKNCKLTYKAVRSLYEQELLRDHEYNINIIEEHKLMRSVAKEYIALIRKKPQIKEVSADAVKKTLLRKKVAEINEKLDENAKKIPTTMYEITRLYRATSIKRIRESDKLKTWKERELEKAAEELKIKEETEDSVALIQTLNIGNNKTNENYKEFIRGLGDAELVAIIAYDAEVIANGDEDKEIVPIALNG